MGRELEQNRGHAGGVFNIMPLHIDGRPRRCRQLSIATWAAMEVGVDNALQKQTTFRSTQLVGNQVSAAYQFLWKEKECSYIAHT